MAYKTRKAFSLRGVDAIDPFRLKCEITIMKREGMKHMIRAALNTGQFDEDGKETKPLSVEYWDFTDTMMSNPKSDTAKASYLRLMEEARKWLQIELNIYKYPSH